MNSMTTEVPIKILAVDDEENILRSLSRLLTNEEYEPLIALSGEEALKILDDNKDIALIISDQKMPGLKGSEFLEKAKEIAPDAIRILLTGYADINAVVDAINKGGAFRYITKPWKNDELIQIIREAVQRYVLAKENIKLQSLVKKQNDELKNWNSQLEYLVQEQTVEIQKKSNDLEILNKDLKETFKKSILAFSGLIELRDKAMANHSRNVAEIALKTARSMGLSDGDIETITIASLLHDIGKIGMPDLLFLKEMDEMDDEGRKEYMKHPVRGQAAIDSVENLRKAGVVIRHHHEWFNGTGFPDKLRKEKIPVGSRIISIADYIENVNRKTAADTAIDISLNKVKEGLGTRFDPQIYPFIESSLKDIHSKITVKSNMIEMELSEKDIRDGMVVSRDVKSGTGIILLPKGTILNTKNTQALRRYYQLDPSQNGVFVLVQR